MKEWLYKHEPAPLALMASVLSAAFIHATGASMSGGCVIGVALGLVFGLLPGRW